MLGSALIALRWILVVIGLVLIFAIKKCESFKRLNIALFGILVVIIIEFSWNKMTQQRLDKLSPTTEISVMTYNLFFKNKSPNSIIEILDRTDSDLLVVQELTPNWKTQLNNSFQSKYPYQRTVALNGTHGIGFYSKFPIQKYQLLKNSHKLPIAQIVELLINDKRIQVINAHLASPAIAVENPDNFLKLYSSNYQLRKQQTEEINMIVLNDQNNFSAQILIGDLNTIPIEPIYRDVKRNWVDLYSVVGNGFRFNFPNSTRISPFLTLDYILLRGAINGTEFKVIDGGSSDHLALIGQVEI